MNLSDAACNNLGRHEYASSITIEGIGGTICAADDGSSIINDYATYTFTFSKEGRMEYEHSQEEVWGETAHTFTKTGPNNYSFSGTQDDMNTSWDVEFTSWGFREKLRLTYDCEAGTCGCITLGEFDLID